jgi:hypothetical protein
LAAVNPEKEVTYRHTTTIKIENPIDYKRDIVNYPVTGYPKLDPHI